MKELRLNKRNIVLLGLAGIVLLSLLLLTETASATPFNGLKSTIVAGGDLPQVVRVKVKTDEGGFTDGTDVTQVKLVRFTLEPGGTFGWHRHGGPVWVFVTSGLLSIYDGDDPTCTPRVYGVGNPFLDPGDHTHIGRNETGAQVEIYAAFMLPAGGETRIDAPNPGMCNIY